MKYFSFFSLLILILATSTISLLHSMEPKYKKLPKKEDLYVTDDSIRDFAERKMLSTGSLDALASLKEQNVVVSLEDLEQQGFKITKPKPLWRRCGAALRRYATTIGVIGTTTMVGILMYYLYMAKGEVTKVSGIVDEAQTMFELINGIIPDAKIALQLAKDFFNCSVPSYKFIEDLIVARNKLCHSCS